jgi:hypothetical protein
VAPSARPEPVLLEDHVYPMSDPWHLTGLEGDVGYGTSEVSQTR